MTQSGNGAARFAFLVLLSLSISGTGCASLRSGAEADRSASRYQSGAARLPFPGSRMTAPEGTNLVVSYKDYRDPLIGLNRGIFAFNDVLYRYALIPISKGYVWVMPDPAEKCIGNFFQNLKSPIYLVNQLLQFKPRDMGRTVVRFGINTTLGIAGLFDPARAWFDIPRAETHLDDTLAQYGAGYGLYLVLPIFGPSDIRNSISTVGETFLNPIPYLLDRPESTIVQGYDYFQEFAPTAERYETLRKKTDDPYIFFRNLYLQGVQRDADY